MDTGSCVILSAAADLFHCECLPVRIGQTPGKGRKRGGDESWSRWTVLYGGKKKIFIFIDLFIYLFILWLSLECAEGMTGTSVLPRDNK